MAGASPHAGALHLSQITPRDWPGTGRVGGPGDTAITSLKKSGSPTFLLLCAPV